MAASFGEQLRLAREARGISLREISEQTRIQMRYLEAIEADDYKRLPGGIFNKSFIKAYAKYVGYDEKEALEAYARTAREQGESPDETYTPYQPHVYTDANATRSPLVTLLLTILILALLSLGVYAALHWYQRRAGEGAGNDTPAAKAPATQDAETKTAPAGSALPATASGAAAGLNIRVKARGERVWIKTRADDAGATETILEPGEAREFKPGQLLRIQYAKVKAPALEVTINGRPAKVPADMKSSLAEMVISKDGYEQLLEQK